MRIIKLYTDILSFAGIKVDENGFAYTVAKDKKYFMVKGKRLILPTPANLKNFNESDQIVFHPLNENIALGESEIIEKLRYTMNIRLNYTFGVLAQNLLHIVSNTGLHKRLSPDQLELVIELGSVDQTTLKHFTEYLLASVKESPDSSFVHIFLKRGGRVRDQKFSRAGIVNFQTYSEVKDGKTPLRGVKFREKDLQAIAKVYKFIFPQIDEPQAYDYGSKSNMAPFLDALLKTGLNLASRFNDVVELFGSHIDSAEDLTFPADWTDLIDNTDALLPEIKRIPMQMGNDGTIENPGNYRPEPLPTPTAPAPVPAPAMQQPMQQPMMQQPQAPMYPQQYAQAMPAQEAPVKTKSGGLDFNAIRNKIPGLHTSPNPFGTIQNPYGQPMMQQPMMQPMMQQPAMMQPMMQQPMMQQPAMMPPMMQQPAVYQVPPNPAFTGGYAQPPMGVYQPQMVNPAYVQQANQMQQVNQHNAMMQQPATTAL